MLVGGGDSVALIIADPSRGYKTGWAAMSESTESCLPLTGLEEALLYHDAGEHGFFSLLWCDPAKEAPIARLRQEKRQLKLKLMAVSGPDQCPLRSNWQPCQSPGSQAFPVS